MIDSRPGHHQETHPDWRAVFPTVAVGTRKALAGAQPEADTEGSAQ